MAAKGLPDVIQKFSAENSEYLRALEQNRTSVEEFVAAVRQMEERLIASGRTAEDAAKRGESLYQAQIDQLKNAVDWQRALNTMVEKNEAATEKYTYNALRGFQAYEAGAKRAQLIQSQINTETQRAADAQVRLQAAQEKVAAIQVTQQEKVAAAEAKVAAAREVSAQRLQAQITSIGASNDRLAVNSEAAFNRIGARASATEALIARAGGSILGAEAALNAATAGGGFSNAAFITAAAANAAAAGRGRATQQSALTDILGPMLGSSLGGALLGGAGGGGGGGGGGFLGGFVGGAFGGLGGGGSTASSQWRTAAGAIATWYPRIHWAMMLTNEVLATAGPAAVAALAATAVGAEGGQTGYQRLSAINAVGQSLGPSLGTTPGQFLGLGDALQKAQTQADPMVWQLMGAAINSINAGAKGATGGLNSFWQMGTSTIAMMDRFGAQVTLDFKHGLGQELSSAVAGGTQDLQQFGDVLGNVGDTFLKVIPALPGVGSDLLTTLQAATKGLSDVAGFGVSTGLLGPALAVEAGSRYGPGIVGAASSLIGRLGQGLTAGAAGLAEDNLAGLGIAGVGGFLGTAAHTATAEEVAAAAARGEILNAGEMVKGTGLAGVLGNLGPLDIGAIAGGVYLGAKGLTYKTPQQQAIAAAETQIGQDQFTTALGGILSQINQLAPTAVPKGVPQGYLAQVTGKVTSPVAETLAGIKSFNIPEALGGLGNFLGGLIGVTSGTNQQAQASGAVQKLTKQYGELLSAGQQISKVFGVSVPEAFQLANQSGLQLATAIGSNGKLTAVALQQVANTQTGIARMTGGIGSPVYNNAVGAVQIAQGLAGSQLSTVNSAYDQLVQNAAAGTTGAVGFSSQIQALAALGEALPSSVKISPSAAKKSATAVAKALTGFTSPASQAAWNAFSSTSTTAPGILQTVENMMDQFRTAQTSGVLTQQQVGQAGAYQAMQLLPYAKYSKAALAQVGIISQETGGPGFVSGESQAQNYKAISDYLDKTAHATGHAGTAGKQYNSILTTMGVGMSSVSKQAENFSSVLNTDLTNSMAAGVVGLEGGNKAMEAFAGSLGGKNIDTSALKTVASTLKAAGESAQSTQLMVQDAAGARGATPRQLAAIKEQVDLVYHIGKPPALPTIHWKSVLDPPPKTSTSHQGGTVVYTTKVDPPHLPPPPHPNPILYTTRVPPPVLPPNPHPAPIIVPEIIVRVSGGGGTGIVPTPGGGVPFARAVTQQTGGLIPGYGGGDIVPAMLEPGELVVPKHMVTSGMVDHLKGKIPGFQGGGVIDVPTYAGGAGIRSALEDLATQLMSFMAQGFAGLSGSLRSGGGGISGMFGRALTGGPPVKGGSGSGSGAPPVPVHIASASAAAVAQLGSSDRFPGAAGPMPKAAMKVIDKFEETFKKLGTPWGKLSSEILSEMLEGVKKPSKETAAMAQAIVKQVSSEISSLKGMGTPWSGLAGQIMQGMLDGIKGNKGETAKMAQAMFDKVTTEVNYMKAVATASGAAAQWGNLAGGLATPTTTAQGQPYQYYTDQQTIAGGGTVSMQQNMSDYLQTMKSFQGDIGKLSKAGINKQMLQSIIGAGPLQGDQEAQSILGGAGGVKGANTLWNQINAQAKQLGIIAGEGVYGYGGVTGALTGKNVHAGAHVTGTAQVHALQSAINSLHGKSVTVSVNIVEGGGTAGTPKLSKAQTNMITKQVRQEILQQAKRNRSSALTLVGYGS